MITIVILIILATISVNIVMNGGIIQRSQSGSKLHNMEAAKEKLNMALASARVDKLHKKEYNQGEYLDGIILEEIQKAVIMEDIVVVDGFSFSIDRSVPKIEEYIGKGQANENIKIVGTMIETDNDTKAKLRIEITYEGEISEISIKGEKVEVPTRENGIYVVEKEVNNNGTYVIIAKDKEGTYNSERIQVTNLAENMEIWNKADMEKFRDRVNEGRSFIGRTVKLMEDIDLQNEMWVPIGNGGIQFRGEFNGNGKKVSGIYIESSAENQALFAENGKDGTIENLTVEGNIRIGSAGAGIVARNYGRIIRCTNNVRVSNAGNMYVQGGIAGHNFGIIEESCNLVDISGWDSVGGICGVNNGIIKKCYNIGRIYATSWNVGGIAGVESVSKNSLYNVVDTDGYIYNCYNTAVITGKYGGYTAGIVSGIAYLRRHRYYL